MNKTGRTKHKKRKIVLLVVLALLCIGGAELAACRHFDPALYDRITAPVRHCVDIIRSAGHQATAAAADFWDRLTPNEPPESESTDPVENETELQLAAEPLIASDLPAVDPAITELKAEDGIERLTGNGISTVYFNQGEEPWASQPYGKDNIGGYGCGPTAMAMVVSSLTDEIVDPAAMAQWAYEHHYWASKSGSYLSIVSGTAEAYGLKCESMTERTSEALRSALLGGRLVVALMGPGHFTQNGHFIVLRGITLSGEVLVADPNSTDRSLAAWDPQLVLDELSSNTASGGPLWSVWAPAEDDTAE